MFSPYLLAITVLSSFYVYILVLQRFRTYISIDTVVFLFCAVLHVISVHLHVFFTYLRAYLLLHTFITVLTHIHCFHVHIPNLHVPLRFLYVYLPLYVGTNWNCGLAPIGIVKSLLSVYLLCSMSFERFPTFSPDYLHSYWLIHTFFTVLRLSSSFVHISY
jgi:hypothetical protein